MELSRGKSYQTGQRRVSAAFREDKVPCSDQEFFHISTTPATQGDQRRSSPFTQPRAVWKPQPHRLIAVWVGIKERTVCDSCPSCQRRVLAAPGEDKMPSPDPNYFRIAKPPTVQGQKRRSYGSIPHSTVWKPQPHSLITDN